MSVTLSDRDGLLAAAKDGDERAFRALVDPHRRALEVHCYRMLGSLPDAEDVLDVALDHVVGHRPAVHRDRPKAVELPGDVLTVRPGDKLLGCHGGAKGVGHAVIVPEPRGPCTRRIRSSPPRPAWRGRAG